MDMDNVFGQFAGLVIPVVSVVAVFTFIAVVSWSENRRKERESYYRSETLRKAMEQGGETPKMVLEMMREEERQEARKRLEGLRLGGMITTATGVGVIILLYNLVSGRPVWLVGVIPLLIGLVLAAYGFLSRLPGPEA